MNILEKTINIARKAVNVVRCTRYYKIREKKPIDEYAIYLESRKCTDFASNIFHIAKELSKKEYSGFKVYIGYKKENKEYIAEKVRESGLDNAVLVKAESAEYYESLACCKYLFTDFHLSHKYVKREGQKIVSLWHGTPLKTLGKDCKSETQASVQRIFLLADYQVYPGEFMKNKMIDAYWLKNIYQGEILCTGYPRNSAFFDEKRRIEIRNDLALGTKRAIMYMPTFRGIAGVNRNEEQNEILTGYFEKIDSLLTDNDVFFVKLHNYNDAKIDCSKFNHIKKAPTRYDNYELQNACDVLVTDYSSVFFDFAVSGRKIILFQYDLEDYLRERGVCIDMDKLPFPRVTTPEALVNEINCTKNYDDKEFLETYANYDNPNASALLLEKVIFGKNDNAVAEKLTFNGKKNIVIYCGPLDKKENENKFWDMVDKLDLSAANYYISYFEPVMYSHAERLSCLPDGANLLGMWGRFSFSVTEALAYLLAKTGIITKKTSDILEKHYRREMIKHFGYNVNIDAFVLCHTGDNDVNKLYYYADGEKISVEKTDGFEYVPFENIADYLNDKYKENK